MIPLFCQRLIGPQDSGDRFKNGIGPILRRLAQDVIDNPDDWRLGGTLIWVRRDGQRVTDQAVESVRRESR